MPNDPMERISHQSSGDISWSVSGEDLVVDLQKYIYKCIYYSSIYIPALVLKRKKIIKKETTVVHYGS